VNQAGQIGDPSEVSQLNTLTGQQLQVSAGNAPSNATGWNAYVGLAPSATSLQNGNPIAIGSSWTLTTAVENGAAPGCGQKPAWFLRDQRLIERG
jgi:hypothetical protein